MIVAGRCASAAEELAAETSAPRVKARTTSASVPASVRPLFSRSAKNSWGKG